MIYSLIISLLIEKPFHLLRPQSFSFQIMSEFLDIFVKFSNFYVPGVGLLTPCSVPRGGFLYKIIVPGGRVFAPFKSYPGGMVMDEIDTCINSFDTEQYCP